MDRKSWSCSCKLAKYQTTMKKDFLENLIHGIFLIAGLITIAAVLVISIYLIISGLPAISQIGLKNFLFGKANSLSRMVHFSYTLFGIIELYF